MLINPPAEIGFLQLTCQNSFQALGDNNNFLSVIFCLFLPLSRICIGMLAALFRNTSDAKIL